MWRHASFNISFSKFVSDLSYRKKYLAVDRICFKKMHEIANQSNF